MSLDKFRRIDIQLDKSNDYIPNNQIAKVGEYNGRNLTVQLTNDGQVESQEGVALNFLWKHNQQKNSGAKSFEPLDISNGIFQVTYPTQMLFEGEVTCSIKIIFNESIIPTLNFTVKVERNPVDGLLIVAENDFSILQEALLKINEWNEKFKERYEGLERAYAKELNEVNSHMEQIEYNKASTAYVNQLIASLSENGPYDAVTTISELNSKYPNGAPGPILVFENNHSYVWVDAEKKWKDFGVYQGIEVQDGSVTDKKTSFLTRRPDETKDTDLYKYVVLSAAGEFYDVDTGKLINNDYTQVYKNTGKITINQAATYKIKCINSVVFYDISGKYISSWQYNSGETGDVFNFQKLPIPKTAITMIGNVNNQFWKEDPTGIPELIETLEAVYFKELKVYEENLSLEVKDFINAIKVENRFKDKVIVNFGDSIIENKNPSVSEFIANDLGATVINAGFGGCMMCPHPNAEYAKFSMTSIADSVVSGDYSLQKLATTVPSGFKTTIELLEGTKWLDVYSITISYGTNDWLNSNILDNEIDHYDKSTYLGALRYSIKKLLQKYPHLKILVTAPIFRSTNDRTENSTNWKNGNGLLMSKYVDGLNEAGKQLFVPVADTFYGLGINQWNESYYFPANDGTHPNAKGRELLGQKIANIIRNVY